MTDQKISGDYVKKTYDEFLSTYKDTYSFYRWFRTPVSLFHYRQSKRAFLSVLKNKTYGKSLEVGGGDGVWTEFLLKHTDSIDFLDISIEMIKRAQERFKNTPQISFINTDFFKNTLPSAQYDFLLSFRNFEYFENQEKGIQEFSRLLKDKGEIIIVTKSPEYDWKGYFNNKKFHSAQISITKLSMLLEKNNFRIVRALPAIMGKKISWAPVRIVFDALQIIVLHLPQFLIPNFLFKYVSESYLIYAVKK